MRYIIYARKSTESEERQVMSIESQLAELKEFAAKEKLEIVASFQEAQTAKEPGRMKFSEMLSFLQSGKADGILSWNPDRLARNSIDGGQIIYLLDTGKIKDLKFPTHWFENTPQGKFMLNIAFGQSKYYVDNLSENIKRGHRQKLRKGIWPGFAPLGYLNNSKTKSIDIDTKKSALVRKCFELYATSDYTLKNIKQFLADFKLDSYKGNVLSTSCVQRMLKNPFYYGTFRFNGELYEGSHEPIISKKLFDDVQQVMNNRGKKKRKRKHEFAFSGFMKCGKCGCLITAETQKGHIYYRCTKKRDKKCSQKYIREEVLAQEVANELQKVSLSSAWAEWMLTELNKEEVEAAQSGAVFAQNLKDKIKELEGKLDILLDAHLDGTISREEYTAKKEKIINEKSELSEKSKDFERNGNHWLEPARQFILAAQQAKIIALQENPVAGRDFLKRIGSNRVLLSQKVAIEPKKSWQILYNLPAEARSAEATNAEHTIWLPG